MSENAIEATDVVKRYPFKRGSKGGRSIFKEILGLDRINMVALNKATLQVRKGETFGLLGPNGAGKTTMIKILSTLLSYEEGEIKVDGIDLRRHPNKVLKHLQTVLTGSRGFEWRLTARQSLEFYSKLYGMDENDARRRIEELLDIVGIRGSEDMMYQRFSSGMGRRLALARALLRDVPILLFDEPTANLDPIGAVKFRRLMKELSINQGKTVLLATHNMYEAQEMCDTIAIIDKGRVIAIGSPTEVRHLFGRKLKIMLNISAADRASEDELIGVIQNFPQVIGITTNRDALSSRVAIEANTNLDLNGLLRTIIARDVTIRGLETSYPSLEDAFVALTTGERI